VDKIIAVVNDDVVTLGDFNAAFYPILKDIEANYKGPDKEALIKQYKAAVLKRLVDNLLIEQEAKKLGKNIAIKDEEIMDAVRGMIAKKNSNLEDFKKDLLREGTSLESLKKEIKTQLLRMKLLRWEIKSKVMVSDEEIGAYYDKHRQEYEGKESVRLKLIFLALPANVDQETKVKIRQDAENLRKRSLGGEQFEMLAAKYSQGPGAAQGGDIGFVEKGAIIEDVDKVSFKLNIGEVSEIIETESGFYIIKAVDKKGAGLKPIAAVREEIVAKIEDEKLEKKYDNWISSVRERSFVDIKMQ
jgi:parvulin-like peptidyl-prolyl isomerase